MRLLVFLLLLALLRGYPSQAENSVTVVPILRIDPRLQVFRGDKPDGTSTTIVAYYPPTRAYDVTRLPQQFQWTAQGSPGRVDTYHFHYHLSRDPTPARSVDLETLRPLSPPTRQPRPAISPPSQSAIPNSGSFSFSFSFRSPLNSRTPLT